MEALNLLLNQALFTKDKNYTSEDGLKVCYDTLEKISEKDKAALILFLYLFPYLLLLQKLLQKSSGS